MYRQNSCNNCGMALLISILAGIAVAVLFSLGLIANLIIGLWIIFGISILVLSLFIIFSEGICREKFDCFKKSITIHGKCLFIGAIGTILTTLISLSASLLITSTFAIITMFLVAFFFILMLISLAQLLIFALNCDCCC